MISKIISFISGIIFGVGLSVSNMINPEKVLGFLDLFGQWDPSLIFVMMGAIIVSAPVFFLFIVGLVLGPIFYAFFTKINIPFLITSSLPIIIIAGFLVGIGTKIGKGCTSGHGICGISLLSLRSIIATIIFMITAIITVKLIG